MNAAGMRLGKITHLDPVGLCFGRLFSKPQFRLSPSDALETAAVHVSLNLFDNPLDGAHSNFLVNGGRDQLGCGGQSELKNSTTSSVSLAFDPNARFSPCSHLRVLAFFEENHSAPNQCQMVGYRCSTYDRFLAGKCGKCDATNGQCRLMSLPPASFNFRRTNSIDKIDALRSNLTSIKYPTSLEYIRTNDVLSKRSDRRLTVEQRDRLAQVIDKLRADTRYALVEGWSTLRGGSPALVRDQTTVKPKTEDSSPVMFAADDNLIESAVEFATLEETLSTADANFGQASTTTTLAPALMSSSIKPDNRLNEFEFDVPTPIGSQSLPSGAINGPLFFLGAGSMSPYCVNYYQFRVLIAESRIKRLLAANALAPNKLAHVKTHGGTHMEAMVNLARRAANSRAKDMLHLTVKMTDSDGHFFKGFSMLEDARSLPRVTFEPNGSGKSITLAGENMLELTMLLNTTQQEPVRVSETILSYYFHTIVLADRIEVNYMSNISPE